jgi:hypothetical protein
VKGGRTAEERLAGRYRDLLDFYPRRYREERGAELVGTLLDGARPGQTRPSRREAWALMVEGLRMRAGTSGYRSSRDTLAVGVQWGVLILLVGMTVGGVTTLATSRGYHDVREVTVGGVAILVPVVLAGVIPIVLVARGRVRWAVPFVVAAGVAHVTGYPSLLRTGWADARYGPYDGGPGLLPIYIDPGPAVVALLATVALVWLRPPPMRTRAAAGAVLVPALWWTPDWLQAMGLLPTDFYSTALMVFFPLSYLAVMAYAVVDARPTVAVTIPLSVFAVELVISMLKFGFGEAGVRVSLVVYVFAIILPVAAAAWFGARRQARLYAPDTVT